MDPYPVRAPFEVRPSAGRSSGYGAAARRCRSLLDGRIAGVVRSGDRTGFGAPIGCFATRSLYEFYESQPFA